MSENLHDIDKLFKDPIEAYEEAPPANVWDAIDNNLDKNSVINIKNKYRKLKRLAIAMLILLLGTLVYELTPAKFLNDGAAVSKTGVKKINNNLPDTKPATARNNEILNTLPGTDANKINDNDNNKAGNSAVKKYKINTDGVVAATVQQQENNFLKKDKVYVVKENDAAYQNLQLQKKGKAALKKSAAQKATISSSSEVPGGYATAESKASTEYPAGYITTEPGLKALEKIVPEKITAALPLKKISLTTINNNSIYSNLSAGNSMAKIKSAKQRKPVHLSATFFFAPQFSFNRIENDHYHDRSQPPPPDERGIDRDDIKRGEQHQSSSSYGILIDIPVGGKWSLQSGVTLMNKNISIKPKKIFAKLDGYGNIRYRFDCSSGYTYLSPKTFTAAVVGDSANSSASFNRLQYLGIPLAIKYNFSLGKFNIIPTIGASANFLLKQKIETEIAVGSIKEKQTVNEIQGLKPAYFNAITGISLEYNFNKRIAFAVMPAGNFALGSITKNAAVKSYPNSFALAGAIKINL